MVLSKEFIVAHRGHLEPPNIGSVQRKKSYLFILQCKHFYLVRLARLNFELNMFLWQRKENSLISIRPSLLRLYKKIRSVLQSKKVYAGKKNIIVKLVINRHT